MSLQDSTTKPTGALSQIKEELEGLETFKGKLYHLAGLEGEVLKIPKETMVDLAGEVDMLIDSIHYRLDPQFKEHREAMAQADV